MNKALDFKVTFGLSPQVVPCPRPPQSRVDGGWNPTHFRVELNINWIFFGGIFALFLPPRWALVLNYTLLPANRCKVEMARAAAVAPGGRLT